LAVAGVVIGLLALAAAVSDARGGRTPRLTGHTQMLTSVVGTPV
jgi:hypothetical protein